MKLKKVTMELISKYKFETVIGSLVICIAGVFLWQIFSSGNVRSINSNGIKMTAKFTNVDGIEIGSDVKIGGVKVGIITDKILDRETYRAILTLSVNKDIKIPTDSNAAVVSSGLLGGKYIDIKPGNEESFIVDGGKLSFTQSSVNLEELIGKFAMGSGSK